MSLRLLSRADGTSVGAATLRTLLDTLAQTCFVDGVILAQAGAGATMKAAHHIVDRARPDAAGAS